MVSNPKNPAMAYANDITTTENHEKEKCDKYLPLKTNDMPKLGMTTKLSQ